MFDVTIVVNKGWLFVFPGNGYETQLSQQYYFYLTYVLHVSYTSLIQHCSINKHVNFFLIAL